AADELVRPRALPAFGRVVRELVADVLEAVEVVRAREVSAQPIVRSRALALGVGARALEVLRPEVAARSQARPQRPAEGGRRLAVERPADPGRDRGGGTGARSRDGRELAAVRRGGTEAARSLPPHAHRAAVRVEGPVVAAGTGVDVVLDDVMDVQYELPSAAAEVRGLVRCRRRNR